MGWACLARTSPHILQQPLSCSPATADADAAAYAAGFSSSAVAAAAVAAAFTSVNVKANSRGLGVPGANEPTLYYNNPDVDGWEFDVGTMAGNGNLVSK